MGHAGMNDLYTDFVNEKLTICEVHRQIYRKVIDSELSPDLANEIISLLEKAYGMGKKMDMKLRQYKNNYDEDWWEKNRPITEIFKRKEEVEHGIGNS